MLNKKTKTSLATLVALVSLFFGSKYFENNHDAVQGNSINHATSIEQLFAQRQSGVMVKFDGEIIKKLPDDNKGSRHQKFIVRLGGQHTVLIAHNIDLAPRVPIDVNNMVTIYGQYEWNEKGGVVHWTHHDPNGSHEHGWIKYQGKTYQ